MVEISFEQYIKNMHLYYLSIPFYSISTALFDEVPESIQRLRIEAAN
jgi:hypothetical protein